MLGININDDLQPFTDQILSGEKVIETRNKNTLKSLVNKTVGIIKTGRNQQALCVGLMKISAPKVYLNKPEFRKDKNKHLIKPNSKFDFVEGKKFGYPIAKTYRFKTPIPVYTRGIVMRKII
jgi:hypothetical protein